VYWWTDDDDEGEVAGAKFFDHEEDARALEELLLGLNSKRQASARTAQDVLSLAPRKKWAENAWRLAVANEKEET
jgi:hypothetical protein